MEQSSAQSHPVLKLCAPADVPQALSRRSVTAAARVQSPESCEGTVISASTSIVLVSIIPPSSVRLIDLDNKGATFFRNVGECLPNDIA